MANQALRYGIIGTGMMGLEHQRNLAAVPGAVLAAYADPDPGSRALAAETVGGSSAAAYEDYRDLLASGDCDVVVVASPNMTHRQVAGDAISSGCHVLVEKPLATTVADCQALVDLARPGQVVWVGLEYRYMPPVQALLAAVRAGEVGEVQMVGIREHRFPFLVKVGNWNRFNENTGGTLVEKCCHFFDLMELIVGRPATAVYASGGRDVNHLDERYDGRVPDILDNALVVVDFDGGARASLDLCMFAEGSVNQEELSVVGDQGKLEAFLPSSVLRRGSRRLGRLGVVEEVIVDPAVAHEGFHHGASFLEHLKFKAAIEGRGPVEVPLSAGLSSVAIGIAAQRSIVEQRRVLLDEVR